MAKVLTTRHHGNVLTSPANLGSMTRGDRYVDDWDRVMEIAEHQRVTVVDGLFRCSGVALPVEADGSLGVLQVRWHASSPNVPMARVVKAGR